MKKLAQDLKERLLCFVEAVKSCGNHKEVNRGETEFDSVEEVSVQERAIRIKAAHARPRGPTRPTVPKGPPPQTS